MRPVRVLAQAREHLLATDYASGFGEVHAAEDAQASGETLLAVQTLGFDVDVLFRALEFDALLVGLERAEVGLVLDVGHGAQGTPQGRGEASLVR